MKGEQGSGGAGAGGGVRSWWSRLVSGEDEAAAPKAKEEAATPAKHAAGEPVPAQPSGAERRASVRLEAPFGQQGSVAFSLRGRAFEPSLYDISLGGVSFWLPREEAVLLMPGTKLARATIQRGEHRLVVDLEVRVARTVKSFLAGEQRHVGCQFVSIDAQQQVVLDAMLKALTGGR